MTNDLSLAAARRPWQQQPLESDADFLRFLRWTFSTPRPAVPTALHTIAMRHDWLRRAATIDHRLSPRAETVEQATAMIAADALTILRCELEARAARAASNPGGEKLSDLSALMRLMAELGASAAKKAETLPDYSSLTPEEITVLTRAGAILARTQAAALRP